jgi:hypothetical protein
MLGIFLPAIPYVDWFVIAAVATVGTREARAQLYVQQMTDFNWRHRVTNLDYNK